MVASISRDLRQRVVDTYKRGGLTYKEVGERFSVGAASVSRWLRLDRETGGIEPRPHGGGRQRLIGPNEDKVLERLVVGHPDWTEDEYAKALNEKLGRSFHASTVGRAIRRLGYGVKKRPSSPPNKAGQTLPENESNTQTASPTSPLRVWFLWTKRVSTRR